MIRKREDIPESDAQTSAAASPDATVIGPGAHLEGSVISAGSLRVDGNVKGTIQADGDVVLTQQADVEATIQAHNVTIAGHLVGDIHAKGSAEIAEGGVVDGNVIAAALVIQQGAVFNGSSTMKPSASASVATSAGEGAGDAARETEDEDSAEGQGAAEGEAS